MINNKTICLCLIVKDEAKTLPRLFASVIPYIDNYVIVDTGSKDDTLQVIKDEMVGIPGRVYERPWVNFGENRSELMILAKEAADYLLIMDADEELIFDATMSPKLDKDAYYMKYAGGFDYSRLFLVSGYLPWKYFGAVHEYIHCDYQYTTGELKCFQIKHHDDGGSAPRVEKMTRDILLLKKAIKDNPKDARNYFYLAQTYKDAGQYNMAISWYKKRVDMGGWEEETYYSQYQIGCMHHNLGDNDKAILNLLKAYNMRPSRFEALYLLGYIHRVQGFHHTASMFYTE
jgi:glycosyltransferase involved in cell wall biosynthesis